MTNTVNLFDLAAATLASTISATIPIRNIASVISNQNNATKKALSEQKNAEGSSSPTSVDDIPLKQLSKDCQSSGVTIDSRKKNDGTLVTVADGAAQQIIVDALLEISKNISIIGEESYEDERGDASDSLIQNKNGKNNYELDCTYEEIFESARREIQQRRESMEEKEIIQTLETENLEEVLCSRVIVYIDPLDGTTSFMKGNYDAVSILVAIVVDNNPVFGVICKPFGKKGEPSVQNSGCFACYGGILLEGAYVAGGDRCNVFHRQEDIEAPLPRAVISKSRAGGVVGKCLDTLSIMGLLEKDPVLVDGAGEKALRLVHGKQDEALWFFPKPGTWLWDVAALDAILLSVGGKLTDKNGKRLDYTNKNRLNACNYAGIVASTDAEIHETCIRIYKENGWESEE